MRKTAAIAALMALLSFGAHAQGSSQTLPQNSGPVYFIALIDVHDADRYRTEYAPHATELIKKHGGKFLAVAGQAETFDGQPPPNRVVLIEFPDVEHIKAWYNSPDYEQYKKLRHQISKSQSVFAVEAFKGKE